MLPLTRVPFWYRFFGATATPSPPAPANPRTAGRAAAAARSPPAAAAAPYDDPTPVELWTCGVLGMAVLAFSVVCGPVSHIKENVLSSSYVAARQRKKKTDPAMFALCRLQRVLTGLWP